MKAAEARVLARHVTLDRRVEERPSLMVALVVGALIGSAIAWIVDLIV